MNLFYIPDLAIANDTSNWVIDLPAEEAKHAIKVLRLSLDDTVAITNGTGLLLDANIIAINKKQCIVKVNSINTDYGKRDYRIHIAVAPTKNIKRFEWFLEKATEMGVDEITPLISFHSERREIKHERENKVITAAIKQSLKAYHPVLNELTSFKDFMERETGEDLLLRT
jgi:16S rRNA (uracil1498-N3)-methyltransferase